MQSFKNRSIAAVGAIVATFATISLAAPVRAESGAIHVHYADLDLASAKGKATLDSRIHAAAVTVCGPTDALMRFKAQDCVRSTIAQANADTRMLGRATRLAAR